MDGVTGLLLFVPDMACGLDGVEDELEVDYFGSLCVFRLSFSRGNYIHLIRLSL